MVGVGDRRVVDADVPGHPLPPLPAAVAALAGARPVHCQVRAGHLEHKHFNNFKFSGPVILSVVLRIENKNSETQMKAGSY